MKRNMNSKTNSALKSLCIGITAAGVALTLSACGPSTSSYPSGSSGTWGPNNPTGKEREPGIFGDDGLQIFGGGEETSSGGNGIGVNSFLWRASLDTLSFIPLLSADPFGGVIITDWYTAAETPNERFKVTTYILDKRLRADGLKVAVFRQVRDANGDWVDLAAQKDTSVKLENAILIRARQLRISTIEAEG